MYVCHKVCFKFFVFLLGHVAHVQYPIFEALFGFGGIFSKFSFFDPLNPPFLKPPPSSVTKTLKNIFLLLGCVAHVQYPIFEVLFGSGRIFSKFSFFDPLNPPFLKKLNILTFFKNPFCGRQTDEVGCRLGRSVICYFQFFIFSRPDICKQ